MAQALQSDDKAAWDRMQSARYRASGNTDEGLRSMRFDAWKAGLRSRMGELDAALCRLDALDTLLVCDTSKPLKINVVREGCELKLNDN